MDHDFEDVEVKRNAPEILETQLKRKKNPCTVITGTMCDPYLPLEEELQITRQCLSLIERYGFGLSIQTKSSRILRDIDILKAIDNKTKCVVQVSLTTYDEDLCRILEPNVSTTFERFQVLKAMNRAGIPTVACLRPTLPFINDSEENLRGLLDYCIEAKVRGVLCFDFGVMLREGNREYFYDALDRHFPRMKDRYIESFGDKSVCNSPNNAKLMKIFRDVCKEHDILYKTKDVTEYLQRFETKSKQSSILDQF
jgi:DNA repair photolyase